MSLDTSPKESLSRNADKDHLLVSVLINGHETKALVDQQTTEVNLISKQFCNTFGIAQQPLKQAVNIQMTVKGSRSKATHEAIVEIDYGDFKEQERFIVVNLSSWDVILGHPALKKHRTIVVMEGMTTSIQPKNFKRFTL